MIFVDAVSSDDVLFICCSLTESTFFDFEDDVRVVCGLARKKYFVLSFGHEDLFHFGELTLELQEVPVLGIYHKQMNLH